MKQAVSSLDCDVIVVNYNAGRLLVDCILSVVKSGVARVIVVDNDSTDDSLEHLKHVVGDERLLVINNSKNLGFATACNIGVRASSASQILFLNPDSVLGTGALDRMSDVLDCSESTGMVGSLLNNPDGTEQAGGRRVFPTPKRAFMRAFGLSRFAKYMPGVFSDFLLYKEPLPNHPIEVEAISGACMLVKREAMDDVGLWDEGYFLHCEDLDWCMRLRQKGWKVIFVPDATVIHILGWCSRNRPLFVEWHKHKGMMRFYRKFFSHQYPGLLLWLVAIAIWLRFGGKVVYYTTRRSLQWLGLRRGK